MNYTELGVPAESFVDLKGSTTFTTLQISKRMKDYESRVFNRREEEALNRITTGMSLGIYEASASELQQVTNFNTFMGLMVAYGITVRNDNELLKNTISYEKAITRLDKYILSVGVPEYSYEQETGEILETITGYSEAQRPTGEYTDDDPPVMIFETVQVPIIERTPIMETIVVPAIEPLPANVFKYDSETEEMVEMPNPSVLIDNLERTEAQGIIDGADTATTDLALQREGTSFKA